MHSLFMVEKGAFLCGFDVLFLNVFFFFSVLMFSRRLLEYSWGFLVASGQ